MDFHQVEAFVAVARQGSLSRAADFLNLTQPSVTARIQALERDMGQPLLVRGRRGVDLTEAGERFLRHAEHALRILAEGRQELSDLQTGRKGRLTIGAAPAISAYLLPRYLARFAASYPNVEIAIRTGHSEDVLKLILNDEVQLGLMRRVNHPAIDSFLVTHEELILVVPPSHRFVKIGEVSIEMLADEGLVLFDQTTRWHELTWGLFAAHGVTPKVRLELDNVETAKRMVESGLGVALLPEVAAEREIRSGALVQVTVTNAPRVRREVLAARRRDAAILWPVQSFLLLLPGQGRGLLAGALG